MTKRFLMTALSMLLLLPALAFAANMQVTSSCSPVAGGTISPVGIKTYGAGQFANYSVTTKAGYTRTSVVVSSGTLTQLSGNKFQVQNNAPAGTAKTLVASFAPITYTITTSVNGTAGLTGTGGQLTVAGGQLTGILPNAVRTITVVPTTGYQISALVVDGSAVPAAIGTASYVAYSAATTANHSVAATFAVVPTATVYAGVNQTVAAFPFSSGFSTALTGSVTSSPAATAYLWSVVSGPTGAAFTNGTTLTPTFTGTAIGTYTVKLRAVVGGLNFDSAVATISVVGSAVADAGSSPCIQCHAGSAPVVAYPSSIHALGSTHSTCTACHNNAGNESHPFTTTSRSVSDTTFKTFTTGTQGLAKGALFCTLCHNGGFAPPHLVAATSPTMTVTCAACHTSSNGTSAGTGDAHGIQDPAVSGVIDGATGCVNCHSFAQKAIEGKVNDNNGVRSITQEFTKWSHHVTGTTLQDAHCAACHLEGKVSGGKVVVDATKHMFDAQTHLRNADDDSDFAWDPAAPNHSNMDNFCMSCHDANGATSPVSAQIQALIVPAPGKVASAKNPFGDTISNRYDKMQRPGVINVSSQFDTTNNSHHGVKGKRYTGRTRTVGDPRAIANAAVLFGNTGAFNANSSATLWGKRSTIYDGKDAITGVTGGPREAFNALYVPLANAGGETNVPQSLNGRTGSQSLGDDSTLHCGDCHTVGQWKPGTAQGYTPTDPATIIPGTSPAIGAHGSNNEYMLRNSKGTDERHTQDAYVTTAGITTLKNPNAAFLVCFNCHSYERYGSVFNATGTTGPHAGEYDAADRCNGIGNNLPFNGYTTGKNTDGTQFFPRLGIPAGLPTQTAFAPGFPLNEANRPTAGEQTADFGNVLGIQCLNCHNSGVGNGYGGIHGSANNSDGSANSGTPAVAAPAGGAFVNGMGNWSKVERFLPGLGNVMHVAGTLGGVTGGTTYGPVTNSSSVYTFTTGGVMNDTNWEQVHWAQGTTVANSGLATIRRGAGCYTLPIGNAASPNSPTYLLEGQPVGGEGSAPVEVADTWGGCDDHQGSPIAGGTRGAGDHGFVKRVNRPITY